MKAKQRFFSLGQSAKMRGVNRHRALKHYHMDGAPKWARNAFVAGWDAADTEHVISYLFEELNERGKDVVRTWLAPDHDWWDSVYEMLDEDSKDYHVSIDRRSRQGRVSVYEELLLYFDSRCGYDVHFDGDLHVHGALATWDDPTYLAFLPAFEEISLFHRTTGIKEGKMRDLELNDYGFNDDERLQDGPMQGALIDELLDGLEETLFFERVETFLQSKIDAFKAHAEKMLKDEYEYLSSDEYIAETCKANEHVFDEDGQVI